MSAEEFALLSGTSVSVGGAGPTTISNGHVGAAASISGLPPATIVNGESILGGPVVNRALDDLITARNALRALPSVPANNLSGHDLSGLTLVPGVYKFDVAAEITLDGTRILTLDAQGRNNVTWVFNIGHLAHHSGRCANPIRAVDARWRWPAYPSKARARWMCWRPRRRRPQWRPHRLAHNRSSGRAGRAPPCPAIPCLRPRPRSSPRPATWC